MIPINEFPYEDSKFRSSSVSGRMLLLRMRIYEQIGLAVGYYDAANDVFRVCHKPFVMTENDRCRKRQIDTERYGSFYCAMPDDITYSAGPRRIVQYRLLSDVITEMVEQRTFRNDIDRILNEAKPYIPYLVCTKDNQIIVTETGDFHEQGMQFRSYSSLPVTVYTMNRVSIIPRDIIRYAGNLTEFGG